MPRTILVSTDFSDVSKDAFPFAANLAEHFDAEIVLTHVIPPLPYLVGSKLPRLSGYENAVVEQADIQLRNLADEAVFKDVAVRTEMSKDPPAAPAILDIMRDTEAVLHVMSNHGRRGAKRVLLGSITEEVVRRSPIPVLTVGDEAKLWEPGQRLIAPVDFGPSSQFVVEAAARLSRLLDLTVHLVHVVEPPQSPMLAEALPELVDDYQNDQEAGAIKELERLAEEAGLGEKFQITIAHGEPKDRILDLAESLDAALIVVGSHGRRGLGRVVLGSVAERVVRSSRWPTLVIKSDKCLNDWPGGSVG